MSVELNSNHARHSASAIRVQTVCLLAQTVCLLAQTGGWLLGDIAVAEQKQRVTGGQVPRLDFESQQQ